MLYPCSSLSSFSPTFPPFLSVWIIPFSLIHTESNLLVCLKCFGFTSCWVAFSVTLLCLPTVVLPSSRCFCSTFHFFFFIPLCCDQHKGGSTVQRPCVLRAPPLILLGGEDEEDGDQGVCVTPKPFYTPHTPKHHTHTHPEAACEWCALITPWNIKHSVWGFLYVHIKQIYI